MGHRLFQVVYQDDDEEWLSAEEIASIIKDEDNDVPSTTDSAAVAATLAADVPSTTDSAAATSNVPVSTSDNSVATTTTRRKKPGKYNGYQIAPDNAAYFLFDLEVTGSKRNYDRIIQLSFIAYDVSGNMLGNFSRLVNPGQVRISDWIKNNILPDSK